MAEFFKSWIMSISGVIVFGSMCEMILPSGVYKKYIRLAIGIMIVAALLAPVCDIEDITVEIPEVADDSMTDDAANQKFTQDIISVYKQKLSKEIKEDIGADAEIECEICEEEKDFGSITSIQIVTDDKDEANIRDKLSDKYGVSKDRIFIEYIG